MLLSACNDDIGFFINSTNYVDIICFSTLVVCIFLCVLINSGVLFNEKRKPKLSKFVVIMVSVLYLFFLLFILFNTLDKSKYEGCYCKFYYGAKLESINDDFVKKEIKKIVNDKVIIVGDSRMEFIENDRDNLTIPINFSFIAKSGTQIDWLEHYAIPKLNEVLSSCDEMYNYHVVINMGVNDLDNTDNAEARALEYYKLYKSLFLKYHDVNFYILSVNPVDESKINKYFSTNIRTNAKIEDFNNVIEDLIITDDILTSKYCDSYNDVDFKAPDGLHYDRNTNVRILNYISNDCVEY